MASIGEASLATRPKQVSRSMAGVPDSLSTSENKRWSHLNGSLVNSEPGIGECMGNVNCNRQSIA